MQWNAAQIVDILKMNSESLSTKYCSGLDAAADAGLKHDVYELIHKLLLHIHLSEPDIEKSILVFLPTYYALEQQWIRLLSVSSTFKVHILHRSIDTDEALQTMKVSKSRRKVQVTVLQFNLVVQLNISYLLRFAPIFMLSGASSER